MNMELDDEYDVILIGTGLKECVLSGLLAVQGKKVLPLDRDSFYGGETASRNLTALWKYFKPDETRPSEYGHDRDWSVDFCTKFIMAEGKLTKMLRHTRASEYLEWSSV